MSFDSDRNLELFTLIWLDKFVDATQENREIQDQLRSIINYLILFDNIQSCEDYLHQQTNPQHDKIILIVSGQLGREIIANIHQFNAIISIFVYCGDQQKHLLWARNYPKIRNVIVRIEDLFQEIEIVKKSDEHILNQSIEFLRDNHQMIDYLLQIPSNLIDQKYFREISLKYYQRNPEFIEEWEHLYSPSHVFDYFFDQTFLSQMLIKSLLTLNIEMIYLLRFYLQDFDEQLKLCENIVNSSKIFFSQLMPIDQIEYLNQLNPHSIIQFNRWIITRLNQDEIFNQLQNSPHVNGLHKVLFQIEENQIGKISRQLIFFPINTKFSFLSIEFSKRIWFVKLNIIDENQSIKNVQPIDFAHYYLKISYFDQSEKLFHLLLKQYPSLNCSCYAGLAKLAQEKGLYQLSLEYYFKCLENRFDLLNNIGSSYDSLQFYDKALKYYFRALALIKSDEQKSLVMNNIGITFAKIHQSERAIEYLQTCLTIRKAIYSENDLRIGICYSNLAMFYLSNQQFNKSFEYFHFALKSFPSDPPNVYKAIIYQNIANAFQQTNHLKKAFQFYQDALIIFKQLKPIDHPNIRFIQQQIQLLKQSK